MALLPSAIIQIKHDEKQKENNAFWSYVYQGGFLNRHGALIQDYLFIILGIAITISAAYIILPTQSTSAIFSDQLSIITQITGNVTQPDLFEKILFNNLSVMVICFVFSLFYASGALFLISWNATVLGVVVGQTAKSLLGLQSIPLVLFSYMPHGTFEFLGYILAGIAGGLISAAVTRHRESNEHFRFVMEDATILSLLAILMLVVGAYIEVYSIMA